MKFRVVGTGPGGREYLLPAALKAVRRADVVVGASRLLEMFKSEGKEEFVYRGNIEAVLEYVEQNRTLRNIAVLVSGDPGFHSLLGAISRRFDNNDYEVVPGVSSFQVAMARRGMPWQEDLTVSCHGKDFEEVREATMTAIDTGRRIILLTDSKWNPSAIATSLLDAGSGNRTVWLGKDLTLPDESFEKTDLETLTGATSTNRKERHLCVMIVE